MTPRTTRASGDLRAQWARLTWRQRVAAAAAALLGIGSAAISLIWLLGGTWLLDTVGGQIEALGRGGGAGVAAGLVLVIALKLVAAVLPTAVLLHPGRRLLRWAGWLCAGVLTVYGLVLTVVGLLVVNGFIAAAAEADRRALLWHAVFWDPWFLIWGLASGLALRRTATPPRSRDQ